MIAIIDYDAGNIKSVEKAFQFLGEETVLSRDRDIILRASLKNDLRTEMSTVP